MLNSQATLVEGITVPGDWAENQRGLRHVKSLNRSAACGRILTVTPDAIPHASRRLLQHIRELQVERGVV